MSFIYPRQIAIHRPGGQGGEGKLGYGAQTQAAETVVISGVRANIELRREGQRSPVGAPGDATRPTHDVRVPRVALANGVVRRGDIVVDDTGDRYQVLAPNWNSLGYAMRVERLEA